MPLQTIQVPALGGLDLASPPQVLAQNPGAAVVLNNYEALTEGGYRKIHGFAAYGDIPDVISKDDIRGIAYYKGIVAVVGHRVLHSPNNGSTWFVVNKDKCTDVASKDLNTLTQLPRSGTGPVEFSVITVGSHEVLIITDSTDNPAMLTIKGDLYSYTVTDNNNTAGYRFCTRYQDHVVYAGSKTKPGSVAFSNRFDPMGFTGPGAWEATVADEVVGLHTFRDYLYIFCRNSIYRVVNLESQANVAIRPVTTKIGCIDGRSIQEIGGDILFLADDGLRYLGATERIDDVSINLVSAKIRPIVSKVSQSQGPISSVVIPSKAQYRLFFTSTTGRKMGVIGTLQSDGQFVWSTTSGMLVEAITMTTEGEDEQVFHIGSPTIGTKRVYYHDVGSTFDGSDFTATWETPWFHMGDSAVRKALHLIDMYLETEGKAAIELTLNYDHEDPKTVQPEPYALAPVQVAARWGEAVWNKFEWGAIQYPLDDVFLEGSGKWIKLTFKDNATDNTQYTIRGYDLQFTPAGRI
jgi:hypothetical protein